MDTRSSETHCEYHAQPANLGGAVPEPDLQGEPASLSQLQCDTAQYIAELTESLAMMSRRNGLDTLTALLGLIVREANHIGRREPAPGQTAKSDHRSSLNPALAL